MIRDDLYAAIREVVREVVREELRAAQQVDEFLTVAQAAQLADVSRGTIRRWIKLGQLTEHRAGPRLRVRRADLVALLAAPRRGHVPPDESPEARARRDVGRWLADG